MKEADPDTIGNPLSQYIATFLGEIGIAVRWEPIVEPTLLPGLTVDRGQLVVDQSALQHPGDLLHEAGHLAILPAVERNAISGTTGSDPSHEMTAIAWS